MLVRSLSQSVSFSFLAKTSPSMSAAHNIISIILKSCESDIEIALKVTREILKC